MDLINTNANRFAVVGRCCKSRTCRGRGRGRGRSRSRSRGGGGAAKAHVAGGGIEGLGDEGRGSIAHAVVVGAEEGATLDNLTGLDASGGREWPTGEVQNQPSAVGFSLGV
jgi:hypothetical protein